MCYKPNEYYKNRLMCFIKENPTIPKGQIVAIGSSHMEFYPYQSHFKDTVIINRAIGGDTTLGLKMRLKESVYDLKPSFLIIQIGGNDLGYYERKPKEIIQSFKEIIDLIKINSPHTMVYVFSIFPINISNHPKITCDIKHNTPDKIQEINAGYKSITEANGYIYLDAYSHLIDDEDSLKLAYTIEGLHLNDLGYQVLTILLKNYLKSLHK